MKKQVLRLNRLDRKRGVERQTMMSSLNLRFIACSTFSRHPCVGCSLAQLFGHRSI
jgi:hypothetical protein